MFTFFFCVLNQFAFHNYQNFELKKKWQSSATKEPTKLCTSVLESGFEMTVEKPKPKQLLRPITTGTGSAMNQSQFLAITCNSLEAREKSRVHGAIGFGFASHWLKNRRESFRPITKRSNRNQVTTFDSYLKSALNFLIDNMTQSPFALLFKTE